MLTLHQEAECAHVRLKSSSSMKGRRPLSQEAYKGVSTQKTGFLRSLSLRNGASTHTQEEERRCQAELFNGEDSVINRQRT